jgi:hypothetical protein
MTLQRNILQADAFLPLPSASTAAGRGRLTGVEIEFGGLPERRAADVVTTVLGGRYRPHGAKAMRIEGARVGTLRVEPDTVLCERKPSPLRAAILELSRRAVPVEIVTDPLPFGLLPDLERLREALRVAGAVGTRKGMLLGFGLHLNPEVPELTAAAILPVLRAYALIEDWLRFRGPIDISRRLLPFVEPYPPAFVDRLAAEGGDWTLPCAIDRYLEATPTRNRGLDLLPLFRAIDAPRVLAALGDAAASVHARTAYHFRLPDCRIDEPGWRIAHEWNRWWIVEAVAADPVLLDRLARDWLRHRRRISAGAGDWRRHVDELLSTAVAVPAG